MRGEVSERIEGVIGAARLATDLVRLAGDRPRLMVAIAGPPGAGKSTFAEALVRELTASGESSVVVPMDGFHFDDVILQARGQRSRKGAAFTFDSAGLEVLLQRIRQREEDVAIPIFDRALELSRAGAAIVSAETRFVLVEGNYLLLRDEPWCRLHGLFDFRVFLDVPISELQRRLLLRIQSFGYSAEHAEQWLAGNDLPNIRHVLESSVVADMTVRNMG
jgi:pantothenate kinase